MRFYVSSNPLGYLGGSRECCPAWVQRDSYFCLYFVFWKQCVVIIITIWHLTSPRFPHIVDKTSSFIVILCTDIYTWIYSILRRSRRKKTLSLTFSPFTYADTHWHKTHAVKQEMETMMKPVCNVLAWNTQKDWQTSIIPSKQIIIYVSENMIERYKGVPLILEIGKEDQT